MHREISLALTSALMAGCLSANALKQASLEATDPALVKALHLQALQAARFNDVLSLLVWWLEELQHSVGDGEERSSPLPSESGEPLARALSSLQLDSATASAAAASAAAASAVRAAEVRAAEVRAAEVETSASEAFPAGWVARGWGYLGGWLSGSP